MALTEADTCRRFITPALVEAGWDLHQQILEQRYFTAGRVVVVGSRARRRTGKRADYLLRYRRDLPLAVVEAKADDEPAGSGLQQAIDYATILSLPFAYATNGREIIEHDFVTGQERNLDRFPGPDELWARWKAGEHVDDELERCMLTPSYSDPNRKLRYYQTTAVNRAVEALARGKERVLLTLATGTGKSFIAFQVCWRLWQARWNRKGSHQRPKILYLADRTTLLSQPMLREFAPFGEALHRIEAEVVTSREMYFATYQQIARDESRPGTEGSGAYRVLTFLAKDGSIKTQ
ncbi:MAG TPA: DEAD/DEAH box helicase family protein [Thermoanaerobaculales bacterium]|nr:DEAD/DEAH box helicase family protein [Thermoanaerobaculales bacterium]